MHARVPLARQPLLDARTRELMTKPQRAGRVDQNAALLALFDRDRLGLCELVQQRTLDLLWHDTRPQRDFTRGGRKRTDAREHSIAYGRRHDTGVARQKLGDEKRIAAGDPM